LLRSDGIIRTWREKNIVSDQTGYLAVQNYFAVIGMTNIPVFQFIFSVKVIEKVAVGTHMILSFQY